MSNVLKVLIFIFVTIISAYFLKKYYDFTNVPIPTLQETWWGPKSLKANDKIRPFKIEIPQNVIDDLKYRLNNAKEFTPPLEGIQHQYGMNTKLLSEVVQFWKVEYNWKEREEYLNKYPQFITNIQGLDIHFIHVKPNKSVGKKVLPLLMLHGWPGSVREFYEIIPYLTEVKSNNFVFELIIPSLPGYGFSKGSVRPGMGPSEVALVLKNLMLRLGFNQFYVQGGDWGAIIASHMSALFPNHVIGTHSNMCLALTPGTMIQYFINNIILPSWLVDKSKRIVFSPFELLSLSLSETGYFHIQATKPDTVGIGLNDSPVGLAAYILEKFTSGTNMDYQKREDGGLKLKYTYTNLLDNIMIYWVSQSMTTAMRLYYEGAKSLTKSHVDRLPVNVPYACAKFYHDMHMPDNFLTTKYKNLIHSNTYDGGHFAALEVPSVLAGDIWKAVEKIETYRMKTNAIP